MNYPQGAPQQPQKQGMSTLAIVLGVFLVLGLGTCLAGAFWVRNEVREVEKNLGEGGLVLSAPAEVTQALAGPKKDYVGTWTSKSGKSSMQIMSNGQIDLKLAEHGGEEKVNAPIAAFIGDDIDLKLGLELRIKVTEAPHEVGDKWQMVAKGVTWER